MRRSDLQIIAEARQRARDGRARQLRERTCLTQEHVALVCGVTQQAVALWETGERLPRGGHALAYGRLLRDMASWAAG